MTLATGKNTKSKPLASRAAKKASNNKAQPPKNPPMPLVREVLGSPYSLRVRDRINLMLDRGSRMKLAPQKRLFNQKLFSFVELAAAMASLSVLTLQSGSSAYPKTWIRTANEFGLSLNGGKKAAKKSVTKKRKVDINGN